MTSPLKKLAFWPRKLTASLRPFPNFIIIGAQKAGSSALYKFICEHPQVERAFAKEPHFFAGKYNYGFSWYRAQFPFLTSNKITGEASPSYISHPRAAKRIKTHLPKAKILFIVRNPTERAISNYFHSVRYNWENLTPVEAFDRPMAKFEEEYALVQSGEASKSKFYNHFAYLHKGLYAFHLRSWLEHFGQNEILIIENSELQENGEKTFKKVINFLEIEEGWMPNFSQKHNVGKKTDFPVELKNKIQDFYKKPNEEFFSLVGKEYKW